MKGADNYLNYRRAAVALVNDYPRHLTRRELDAGLR